MPTGMQLSWALIQLVHSVWRPPVQYIAVFHLFAPPNTNKLKLLFRPSQDCGRVVLAGFTMVIPFYPCIWWRCHSWGWGLEVTLCHTLPQTCMLGLLLHPWACSRTYSRNKQGMQVVPIANFRLCPVACRLCLGHASCGHRHGGCPQTHTACATGMQVAQVAQVVPTNIRHSLHVQLCMNCHLDLHGSWFKRGPTSLAFLSSFMHIKNLSRLPNSDGIRCRFYKSNVYVELMYA